MKKIFSAVLVLCLACSFSLPAFADMALPKGVSCGNCHNGSFVQVSTVEDSIITIPCIHGIPLEGAQDRMVKTYRNYYDQCNNCRFRIFLYAELISQTGWICDGGTRSARSVVCGACDTGRLIEYWNNEYDEYMEPCRHGDPAGTDIVRVPWRVYVRECNNCDYYERGESVQNGPPYLYFCSMTGTVG